MKYENIKNYGPEKFRRITGLRIETYKKCIEILNKRYSIEHADNVRKSGRKSQLSMEDKLLAEYRTYVHIAANYGVHESQIVRYVHWVETTLIKDGKFRLPRKKELLKSDTKYEIVLIDAKEMPIERPKRGKNYIIPGRKNVIQ